MVFAGIDVSDPKQVGRFMYWLERGEWPEDWEPSREPKKYTMEDYVETLWFWDAPRHRMLKLLWQLLQDNHGEHYFYQKFTMQLGYYIEDAAHCATVLPPIQEKLRWVLEGVNSRNAEDAWIGQGSWGEDWFLPVDRVSFVRQQLGKVRLGVLEKESDYEDMLEMVLRYEIRNVTRAIAVPIADPDRHYLGEAILEKIDNSESYNQRKLVWVVGIEGRQGLINVEDPVRATPGTRFSWGYGGGGPGALSRSILADATEGDIALAEEYWASFQDEVVAKLPMNESFQLPRGDVLNWLESKGIGDEQLRERLATLAERVKSHGAETESLKTKLVRIKANGGLRSQRFDYVPQDFESALYLDLLDMVRYGSPEGKRLAELASYLVKEGEGQNIEFKQSFAATNEAIESICAFANASGGKVLFGVRNDQTITGVQLGGNSLENLANTIHRDTDPSLSPSIDVVRIEGKTIVLASVEQAGDREVVFTHGRAYRRVGKTNQLMTPTEIRRRLGGIQ